MGNQENAPKDDIVLATTTRLFRGRVVEDVDWKTSEPLLASTPAVGLSSILGRNPTLGNHITAVNGVDLTKLAPPHQNPPRRGRRISKTHIAKA